MFLLKYSKILEYLPWLIWLFSVIVLIHNLSHVQASQRVLNQSHTFGFTYLPDEYKCLISQWKNLFVEKFLLKCKNLNALIFC